MTTHADDRVAPSICSRCRRDPPGFQQVSACWEYDDAVADALRRVKYGEDFAALRALCRGARPWFETQLAELPPSAPLIPVPAHRIELRRRGFHVPTLALRLLLTRQNGARIRPRLAKIRQTPRQAGLSVPERRKNVRGVFRDTGDEPTKPTAVIFDDVMTTGTTADEAASALLDAGFETVRVLVLARAPRARDFRSPGPSKTPRRQPGPAPA